MKRLLRAAATAAVLAAVAPSVAAADGDEVLVTIKPLHALVAAVMQGTGTPGLLIDGAASPHSMSLKPSQARDLQKAKVVFWVGDELETFLVEPLKSLAPNAKQVALMDAHDLIRLPFREGGAFEAHEHDDEHAHRAGTEHANEAEHKHDEAREHEHEAGHKHEGEHEEAHHHGHDEIDAHAWLDPENARVFVHEAEEALSAAFPRNAATYKANAARVSKRIDDLIKEIETTVEPVHDKGFIVFHDAYQYMEKRFDLHAVGSITTSPEILPGADRLSDIREKIKHRGAHCVFAEPQFEPKIVSALIEGTNARSGVLDPLGASIPKGQDHYFEMMRANAKALRDCLSHTG